MSIIEKINIVYISACEFKKKIISINVPQLKELHKSICEYNFEDDRPIYENYINKINHIINDLINYKKFNLQYIRYLNNEISNISNICEQILKVIKKIF